MMVNSDVDCYTNTLMLRETQKNNNQLKAKRILNPKYNLSGGPLFTFSLPRGDSPLFSLGQL